jgi:hypothetical protein
LFTHPKWTRLLHVLQEPKPHILGYLELIWRVGYESGNPEIGTALDVELAAEYPGPPGKLARALVKVGFLDRLGHGQYAIHDLFDHAPEYVIKRAEREEGRKHKYAPRRRALTAPWRRRASGQNGAENRISPPNSELGGLNPNKAALPHPHPHPEEERPPPPPQGGQAGGDLLQQAWQEWLRYRAELGKPITPTVEARHRKILSDNPVIAVTQIRTAIERGYLAPAKPDKLATTPATPETKAQRDARVLEERARLDAKFGTRRDAP